MPSFNLSISSFSASSMAGSISFKVISATAIKGFNAESFNAMANSLTFCLTSGSSKTRNIILERSFALSVAISTFSLSLSGSDIAIPNDSNILSIIEIRSATNFATIVLITATGGSVTNLEND